jgi:hypothetical protein
LSYTGVQYGLIQIYSGTLTNSGVTISSYFQTKFVDCVSIVRTYQYSYDHTSTYIQAFLTLILTASGLNFKKIIKISPRWRNEYSHF